MALPEFPLSGSVADRMTDGVSVGRPANPYAPYTPTMPSLPPSRIAQPSGDIVRAGLTNMAQLGEQFRASRPQAPVQQPTLRRPDIAFNEEERKWFVQGTVFDEDDDRLALESAALLDAPGTGLPTEGNWQPLDVETYQQYLEGIRNPGMGRLASKSFGRAVDQFQRLGGSALQLVGAEELGGRIVAAQDVELNKTAPYDRAFTDIGSSPERGMVDWLVATAASFGPDLLSSVALALGGAAVGTATAGPVTGTAAGFFAGLFGKKAFQANIDDLITRYRAGTLKETDPDFQVLKNASAVVGATAANLAGSYVQGAGDIYGESRSIEGVGPEDFGARLAAFGLAIPYAAAESMTEVLLARRILGFAGTQRPIPEGAGLGRRGAEYLRRGAIGAGVGGTLEGGTEAFQEALVLAGSGQDLTSDEAINRFINSFAAGAAMGGPIGGIANLGRSSKEEINMLDSTGTQPKLPPNAPAGAQGSLFGDTTAQDAAAFQAAKYTGTIASDLGSRAQEGTVTREYYQNEKNSLELFRDRLTTELDAMLSGGQPTEGAQGQARIQTIARQIQEIDAALATVDAQIDSRRTTGLRSASLPAPGQLGLFRPTAPTVRERLEQQRQNRITGQLDLFGEPTTPNEYQLRGRGTLPDSPGYSARDRSQGALQFAPAAPEGIGFTDRMNPLMANRLQPIQDQMVRGREYDQAEAQRQAQIDAELEAIYQQGQRGFDLQTLQEQEAQELAQDIVIPPPRQFGPRQAEQLRLPLRTPRTSLREALRRGTSALPASRLSPDAPPGTQGSLFPASLFREENQVGDFRRAPTQLSLFTQKGEPTVAAMKGAGPKTKVVDPQDVAAQAKADADAAKAAAKKKAAEDKLKKGEAAAKRKAAEKAAAEKAAAEKAAAEKAAAEKAAAEKKADDEVAPTRMKLGRMQELARKLRQRTQQNAAETETTTETETETTTETDPDVEPTDMEVLQDDIVTAEEAYNNGDVLTYRGAIANVFQYAYLAGEDSSIKKLVNAAREYLATRVPSTNDALKQVENEVFLELIDLLPKDKPLQAVYTRDVKDYKKGDTRPWYNFALSRGLVDRVKARVTISLEPERYAAKPADNSTAKEVGKSPEVAFATLVYEASFGADNFLNADGLQKLTARATELYDQLTDAQKDFVVRGNLLRDYFRADGTPKIKFAIKKRGEIKYFLTTETTVKQFDNFLQSLSLERGATYEGDKGLSRLTTEASTFYNLATNAERAELTYKGNRMSDYFNEDGAPIIIKISGKYRLSPTELSDEARAQIEQTQREARAATIAADAAARQETTMDSFDFDAFDTGTSKAATGTSKLPKNEAFLKETNEILDNARALWDKTQDPRGKGKGRLKPLDADQKKAREAFAQDILAEFRAENPESMFYRDDGTPLTTTVAPGKVRLLIKNFLSQLRVKPTVSVYANVEDLKKSNPGLYRRAAAARSEGDFDTTNAAGYSFGPDVIIFTDFVRTEQQLKFVLAHETLGHFGLRGVVPQAQLSAVLNRIYDSSSEIQADVQARMSVGNMPKLEAIEEYVADNAATLDASVVNRAWNLIKTFLNKFGVKFHDDHARYFVNLARRYVRRGDTGNFFTARALADGMTQIIQDGNSGRYSREDTTDLAAKAYGGGALNTPRERSIAQSFEALTSINLKEWPNLAKGLEYFQSLNNKARRSYGLTLIYELYGNIQRSGNTYIDKYNRMTAFTNAAATINGEYPTDKEKLKAGELLARSTILRTGQYDDAKIRSFGPLVSTDSAGNIVVNELLRAELERAGTVTAEEFRKGFDITYGDGSTQRFQADVDDSFTMDPATGAKIYNDPVWRIYNELRSAINESAIDKMKSTYGAVQSNIARTFSGLEDIAKFDAADLAILQRIADTYKERAYRGSSKTVEGVELDEAATQRAEDFVIAFGRALFNPEVYAVWMKEADTNPDIAKDLAEFQKAEYDDIRAQLSSLRDKVKTDSKSYDVQKVIRDMFMFDNQALNADLSAKRTILNAYAPIARRGDQEIRLVAVDKRGNVVKLDPGVRDTLPYFHQDGKDAAQEIAAELEQVFDGDFTLLDAEGRNVTVTFRADVSKVRQNPGVRDGIDFNAFINTLTRLNIGINPKARERIITTLTRQNSRIRSTSLRRSGTEGWDKDVVRSVSEYLQTMARVSAKAEYQDQIRDVMDNDSNWKGDAKKLKQLEQAVKDAPTDGARAQAQLAYDRYAFMYRYMAASTSGEAGTVTIAGKKVPTLGRGEDYRLEANKIIDHFANTDNFEDPAKDYLSGDRMSQAKTGVVAAQLGGSIASAFNQLLGLPINLMSYLATYNRARAFGAGYGWGKAINAMSAALADLKSPKFSESAFIDRLIKDNKYADYGLTRDEAQFLLEQTESGLLGIALSNALLGSARGKVTNAYAKGALDAWMSAFNFTEQLNRRIAALSTYRLERDRLIARGITDPEELFKLSSAQSVRAVITTQGDYTALGRPVAARGPIGQYLMMYKVFLIITIELLRNLPRSGQIAMLAMMWFMSGIRGLPFAEDIFDLLDTILQSFGIPINRVEQEMAMFFDDILPGSSKVVMRGFVDSFTGLTIGPRVGFGNLIPATGIGIAGADFGREAADLAGPMFSGVTGFLGTALSLGKYGAETIGLRDDTTSLTDILRNFPAAGVRGITDGMLYMSSGTITNNRGQVVSADAPLAVSIGRMLGYYPASATEQNDIVRLGRQNSEYVAAIKADYIGAYIKAKLANDSAGMRRQIENARNWNRAAKGSGLELSGNFRRDAERAAREASRPTIARYLKASPAAGRDNIEQMADIFGLNEELD